MIIKRSNSKAMSDEARARQIVLDAKRDIKKYLEEDCPYEKPKTPRIGIYYRSKKYQWILDNLDLINRIGVEERIKFERKLGDPDHLYVTYFKAKP
jgi:hypothetical protein